MYQNREISCIDIWQNEKWAKDAQEKPLEMSIDDINILY